MDKIENNGNNKSNKCEMFSSMLKRNLKPLNQKHTHQSNDQSPKTTITIITQILTSLHKTTTTTFCLTTTHPNNLNVVVFITLHTTVGTYILY